MNCLVVETEGRLLIVDCGVMFANDSGIDLIHPSFEYLKQRQEDLEGVVLTHAHEDHLSGIPFLLRELDLPIYCGDYAAELLKNKSSEHEHVIAPMLRPLTPGDRIALGPFSVTPFPMPHSIVQNTGLVIDMPKGRILHTGDFKLGIEGADKGVSTLDTLKGAAEGRVDLMLADATGAEEREPAGDESEVYEVIDGIFDGAPKRIFAAIFSSNIRRLDSLLRLASRHGRTIGLAGRSVQNHVRIGLATSELFAPAGLIQPLEKVAEMPKEKTLVIVSGTQGEFRSALSRLAHGHHHLLKVTPEDRVILSSRFIPGNEIAISMTIDNLLHRGAAVYHRYNTPGIHVSGHGSAGEIAAAIRTVGPKSFMPVHGTLRHLKAGAALARSVGVQNVAVATDGQTLHWTRSKLTVEDGAPPTRRVYIDNGGRLPGSALKERRLLGTSGVISIAFLVDDSGVPGDIRVTSRGVVAEEIEAWASELVSGRVRSVAAVAASRGDRPDALQDTVRNAVRKLVQKRLSRDPLVLVSVIPI